MPKTKDHDDRPIWDLMEKGAAFDRLLIKGHDRKPRLCLRCRVEFMSMGAHNRLCGSCAQSNSKASVRQGYVAKDPTQTTDNSRVKE